MHLLIYVCVCVYHVLCDYMESTYTFILYEFNVPVLFLISVFCTEAVCCFEFTKEKQFTD